MVRPRRKASCSRTRFTWRLVGEVTKGSDYGITVTRPALPFSILPIVLADSKYDIGGRVTVIRRTHHKLPVDLRHAEGQPPAARRLPPARPAHPDLPGARRRQGNGRGVRL